jgi:hypothetical protein
MANGHGRATRTVGHHMTNTDVFKVYVIQLTHFRFRVSDLHSQGGLCTSHLQTHPPMYIRRGIADTHTKKPRLRLGASSLRRRLFRSGAVDGTILSFTSCLLGIYGGFAIVKRRDS